MVLRNNIYRNICHGVQRCNGIHLNSCFFKNLSDCSLCRFFGIFSSACNKLPLIMIGTMKDTKLYRRFSPVWNS